MTKPILNGGFIQLDNAVFETVTKEHWGQILGRMKALGMKTVIIQYLGQATEIIQELDEETEETENIIDENPPNFLFKQYNNDKLQDPTAIILSYAEALKIEVYLGLVSPPSNIEIRNAQSGFWKEDKLKNFTKANQEFAQKVWEEYKDYSGWKGWYIPLESWVGWYPEDFGEDGTEFPEEWAAFYRNVAKKCKCLNSLPKECDASPDKRPVAISPALPEKNGNYLFEAKTESITKEDKIASFIKTLDDTDVDIVMLQDSVGAKGWEPEQLGEYYSFIKKICEKNKMSCWANIESFEKPHPNSNDRRPCNFERLKEQLEVTVNFDLEQRVTFDFFHYMNGVVKLERWDSDYFKSTQKLYNSYAAYAQTNN